MFYDALMQSPPSAMALASGQLSIGAKQFSLAKVYQSHLPPATDSVNRCPQETLDALLHLQEPDGRWKSNAALSATLHHLIPECPAGVGEGMWATACAVACLRRYIHAFDRLEAPCALGLTHVDVNVYEWAKQKLPPIPVELAAV